MIVLVLRVPTDVSLLFSYWLFNNANFANLVTFTFYSCVSSLLKLIISQSTTCTVYRTLHSLLEGCKTWKARWAAEVCKSKQVFIAPISVPPLFFGDICFE